MSDLCSNAWSRVAAATAALIVLLTYVWLRQRYNYWRKRRIPYIKPTFLLGNLKTILRLRTSFGDFFGELYESKTGDDVEEAPVIGVFWFLTPALVIRNTELIRRILIKESNMFQNRYEAADALHDSWGALTLPLAKYSNWRESRKCMSKFFTSGQMKQRMYPLMLRVSQDLERHIERRLMLETSHALVIEVKELCALYTTDLTALLAFSIEADSLMGNLQIRKAVIDMFRPSARKALNFFLIFFLPHWTRWLRAKVFPTNYMKFIRKMLDENLKKRNIDFNMNLNNNQHRDDLIDLLLRFQNDKKHSKKHKFAQHCDFLAAQVAIMLIAGFETSSSLIAFILYELAKQPNLQRKLRNELHKKFYCQAVRRQTLEYEELQELVYLNMVVAEGLRMYPAAAFINRECTPNENCTSYSLRPFVDFDMPKDMPAYISILGLQRDKRFWPNPEHFNPERFHPDRIKFIKPMTYIPFGAGPHACIGSRLGVLQVKLGLVHILKDYNVECTERTPKKITFEPTSFMLQNKGGIELKFIKK